MVDQQNSSRPVCFMHAYRETYGMKIPLSSMDDSCMILWWVKNKRPYQLFVTSSRDFMDMSASKISMVTFWSRRTSDVAQGGMTMQDSATGGSVISQCRHRGHWSTYLYKSYTDLFQKKSFHQYHRLQFQLNSQSRLMTKICNLKVNHSKSMQPLLTPPRRRTSCPFDRFTYAGTDT